MRIHPTHDGARFRDLAFGYLAAREAENNLILGISDRYVRDPGIEPRPEFRVAIDGDEVVGVTMRTPPRGTVISTVADNRVAVALATDAAATDPETPGVNGPVEAAATYTETFCALTGRSPRKATSMRIHRLSAVVDPKPPPGTFRRAAEGDIELVYRWFLEFHEHADTHAPTPAKPDVARYLNPNGGLALWLWEDGGPVSMVGSHDGSPTGRRIGPVFTPEHLRGRGYARALTAEVSRIAFEDGKKFCFLYTDLANPISNRIYAQIGYEPVCDVDQWFFD